MTPAVLPYSSASPSVVIDAAAGGVLRVVMPVTSAARWARLRWRIWTSITMACVAAFAWGLWFIGGHVLFYGSIHRGQVILWMMVLFPFALMFFLFQAWKVRPVTVEVDVSGRVTVTGAGHGSESFGRELIGAVDVRPMVRSTYGQLRLLDPRGKALITIWAASIADLDRVATAMRSALDRTVTAARPPMPSAALLERP